MLPVIFKKIYSLSWNEVLLLLIVCLCVYVMGMYHIPQKRFKRLASGLLLFWTVIILYRTIFSRAPGEYGVYMILFHSYRTIHENAEVYRSNFMNILLFFPGGLLLTEVLPDQWSYCRKGALAVLVLGLLSILLEYSQFYFQLGTCEVDDIFHNTVGAVFGCIVAFMANKAADIIRTKRGKMKNA